MMSPRPQQPVPGLHAWLLLAVALLLSAGGAAAQDRMPLVVDEQLSLEGHSQFSTRQLRRRLGAGTRTDSLGWRLRLDSLALEYAERGFPLLAVELRDLQLEEGAPPRIRALRLDEGPRLVIGRVGVYEAGGLELPEIARDLPPGRMASSSRLAEGLDAWLRRLEAEGRPLSRLQLRELRIRAEDGDSDQVQLDLDFDLVETGIWRPAEIRIEGLVQVRPATVRRLARLEVGQDYDPRRLQEARRRLLASGWFRSLEGPRLARGPAGPALLLRVEEAPAFRFDGLAGLLPPTGDESTGRLSFHLQLDLDNLLGTGRELHLLASRPDGISQTLQLGYREPFLLGWPLGAGARIEQRLQDTSWVELSLEASLDWEPLPGLLLEASGGLRELLPDSLGGWVARGVDPSRSRLAGLEARVDRRDDPRNPRLGWEAGMGVERQRREPRSFRGLPPRRPAATLERQTAMIRGWWPLSRHWVLHPGLSAGRLTPGAPPEERLPLGGSRGPRGTREDEIRADEFGLFQLELRYLLGPAARAALFGDWLRWRQDGQTLSRRGLGAALVLPVRHGQVELQYALGAGRAWDEGLVHVRLITRF
jgi:translocation and assembly module TamA